MWLLPISGSILFTWKVSCQLASSHLSLSLCCWIDGEYNCSVSCLSHILPDGLCSLFKDRTARSPRSIPGSLRFTYFGGVSKTAQHLCFLVTMCLLCTLILPWAAGHSPTNMSWNRPKLTPKGGGAAKHADLVWSFSSLGARHRGNARQSNKADLSQAQISHYLSHYEAVFFKIGSTC